jgi:hypothetical protein
MRSWRISRPRSDGAPTARGFLVISIVFAVVTFWFFAQTMLNIAPGRDHRYCSDRMHGRSRCWALNT